MNILFCSILTLPYFAIAFADYQTGPSAHPTTLSMYHVSLTLRQEVGTSIASDWWSVRFLGEEVIVQAYLKFFQIWYQC